MEFSVLMSLYIKEKVEYARACFDSLLRQTCPATQWVIVEDGPLTQPMYELLAEYEKNHPGLILRVPLEINQGLGKALREGILHCSYELIARMDTDDIAREDRFEKQLQMFRENPRLDICGSHIQEFETVPEVPSAYRRVPVTDLEIKKYQKRRDAFNHMTVMFKKSAVLAAGSYQHALLMEDSLLWVNMMKNGAQCANVDDCLVFARTDAAMFGRRGGWSYFKKYHSGRKKIYETGYITLWDYIWTLTVQFGVAIVPNSVRTFIYKKLLR